MEYLNIDGLKLRNKIKEHGYKLTEAGKAIGYSGSYFSNIISEGRMPDRVAILVDNILGIPKESYEISDSVVAVDTNELYNVIFTAVRNAFDAVFDSGRVNMDVYQAVRGALKSDRKEQNETTEEYIHG